MIDAVIKVIASQRRTIEATDERTPRSNVTALRAGTGFDGVAAPRQRRSRRMVGAATMGTRTSVAQTKGISRLQMKGGERQRSSPRHVSLSMSAGPAFAQSPQNTRRAPSWAARLNTPPVCRGKVSPRLDLWPPRDVNHVKTSSTSNSAASACAARSPSEQALRTSEDMRFRNIPDEPLGHGAVPFRLVQGRARSACTTPRYCAGAA